MGQPLCCHGQGKPRKRKDDLEKMNDRTWYGKTNPRNIFTNISLFKTFCVYGVVIFLHSLKL